MAGLTQHVAGPGQQGAADAAALVVGIDEQRPDRAVARVGGGEAQNAALLLPHPDARVLGEPVVVGVGNARGIQKLVLAHGEADLADARPFLETGAADAAGHAGLLPQNLPRNRLGRASEKAGT